MAETTHSPQEAFDNVPSATCFWQNKPRSATCIASKSSQLMVISKSDYTSILMNGDRDSPVHNRMRMMSFLNVRLFAPPPLN